MNFTLIYQIGLIDQSSVKYAWKHFALACVCKRSIIIGCPSLRLMKTPNNIMWSYSSVFIANTELNDLLFSVSCAKFEHGCASWG